MCAKERCGGRHGRKCGNRCGKVHWSVGRGEWRGVGKCVVVWGSVGRGGGK